MNTELAKSQHRLHLCQNGREDAIVTLSEDSGLADHKSQTDSRSEYVQFETGIKWIFTNGRK